MLSGPGTISGGTWYKIEFDLKPDISGEELVESYVGVDFSIMVSIALSEPLSVRSLDNGLYRNASFQKYRAVLCQS